MEKNYLEEIILRIKREEKNRERKIEHLVKFLKSSGLEIISDDIATIEKKEVIETEDSIFVIGDGTMDDEDGIEKYVDNYKMEISKKCLLDWEEDWFLQAINLFYVWENKQIIVDGARYYA